MARIRTVKPEFWTDGVIVDLSPWARLFYIGTWNFALCDQGHLDDDPKSLKLKILPADNVDAVSIVDELIAAGRIVRKTTHEGRTYLHIPRLSDHQKTETRWNTRCAYCAAEASGEPTPNARTSPNPAEPRASSGESSETLPRKGKERKGEEGKGKEHTPREASGEVAAETAAVADAPVRAPRTSAATEAFERWWSVYPKKDAKGAARKAWAQAIKKADPAILIAAAEQYRDHPTRRNAEIRFTKNPATWLNAECWHDERPAPGTAVQLHVVPDVRPATSDLKFAAGQRLAAQLREEAAHGTR